MEGGRRLAEGSLTSHAAQRVSAAGIGICLCLCLRMLMLLLQLLSRALCLLQLLPSCLLLRLRASSGWLWRHLVGPQRCRCSGLKQHRPASMPQTMPHHNRLPNLYSHTTPCSPHPPPPMPVTPAAPEAWRAGGAPPAAAAAALHRTAASPPPAAGAERGGAREVRAWMRAELEGRRAA